MKKDFTFEESIIESCDELKRFLLEKNKSYGNSVLEPINIFSKLSSKDQINVRIDDKLSRLFRGKEYAGDDTLKDLSGYERLRRAIDIYNGLIYEDS